MADSTDVSTAQTEDPGALRDALVDQMGYLLAEIEALKPVVRGLPDDIKEGRPGPDVLTMKELYGAIATLDEEVREPRVERVVEEDEPAFSQTEIASEVREGPWNELEMEAILDRVETARNRLVDRLDALPLDAWHRTATLGEETYTLFELVHEMTQEDADRLRALGYRLHGAHLSDRDEPLPT